MFFILFLKNYLFICFFAALGLCCSAWVFSGCEQGLLSMEVHGFLIVVASPVAEHRPQSRWVSGVWHAGSAVAAQGLQNTGSVIVAHGLSCSTVWGNLLEQGIRPVSPALAGRVLSTVPPGKSYSIVPKLLHLDL